MRPVLDAAYASHRDEEAFATAIARTTHALLRGAGAFVVTYRGLPDGSLDVRAVGHGGVRPDLVARFVETFRALPQDFVRESLRTHTTTESTTHGRSRVPAIGAYMRAARLDDLIISNGFDASGLAVLLVGQLPYKSNLTAGERHALTRLSAHCIAALRLGARAPEEAVARIAPDGALHGDRAGLEDDEADAVEALRRAARALVALRSARAGAVADSLGALSPRVLARWSVVGHFTDGGEELAVVRRNPAPEGGAQRPLTTRERQVLALVEAGHSLKFAAYELGIGYATVRVLVARARRKLQGPA